MTAALTESAPPALAPPPGHPRFALFDSLRAIAALGIVAFHAGGAMGVFDNGRSGPFVQHFDAGVTLFFLISGFLLYRPYVSARVTGRSPSRARDFLRRRALRIVPAYWFALTIAAIVVPYDIWGRFYVFYGFAQAYSLHDLNQGLFPAWTLGCEVLFYAGLPLYAAGLARVGARVRDQDAQVRVELAVLALMAVASIVARGFVYAGDIDHYHAYENWAKTVFTTFGWFAVGMALAVVSVAAERRDRPPRGLGTLIDRPGLAWLGAGAAFVLVSERTRLPVAGQSVLGLELVEHFSYAAIAALLLVPAVWEGDGRGLPRRILGWRWLAWLGLVSYGIYLWHEPVIHVLQVQVGLQRIMPDHPYVPFTAGAVAITVACAAISYYVVERPALRYKHPGRRRASGTLPPRAGAGGGLRRSVSRRAATTLPWPASRPGAGPIPPAHDRGRRPPGPPARR